MTKEVKQKLTLDRPVAYQIKVPGKMDVSQADWTGTLEITIENEVDCPPTTALSGDLDQAALHGLLRRLYSLGLPLISVICVDCGSEENSEQ
jgi:hypothetical protein